MQKHTKNQTFQIITRFAIDTEQRPGLFLFMLDTGRVVSGCHQASKYNVQSREAAECIPALPDPREICEVRDLVPRTVAAVAAARGGGALGPGSAARADAHAVLADVRSAGAFQA